MLRVLKNLKNSFISVVFIVLLLFVQAQADLKLPDYTSKIVNTGIQAGGIETAVPEIIRKDDLETVLMFTENKEDIINNYTLVGTELTEYEQKIVNKYIGKDKTIEAESAYILKDINKEEKEELASKLATPLLEVSTISNEETANQIKSQMTANMPEQQKAYIQDKGIKEILSMMPDEQKNTLIEQFTSKINEMSDSIKSQAAVSSVKQIYKNVGVDTDKIQNSYIIMAGFQMLGVALVSMISAIIIMLLSARVAAKLSKTLREKVFAKVLNFSNEELNGFSTASLITRSTNDIQQIQQLMTMLFRVVVYAPVIGIGGFIKVLTNSDSSMAWIIGVAILAILFVVNFIYYSNAKI
mgnify:CR=1 FL=1